MAKLHSNLDVFVDGELLWERAMVVEDQRRGRLRVTKRSQTLASFTAATYVGRQGMILTWTATDEDGEVVSISGAGRQPPGCAKCGRR